MRYQYIYEKFEEMFNKLAQEADEWYNHGENCIRISFPDRGDYIFTYNGDGDWRLETMRSHLISMKGVSKKRV